MHELHRVSGRQAIHALERLGFEQVRQRCSNVILKKQTLDGAAGCSAALRKDSQPFDSK